MTGGTAPEPDARRLLLPATIAASMAVVATFALWVRFGFGGSYATNFADMAGQVPIALAALAFALRRALRAREPHARAGWLLLAASMLSYAVSSVDFSWYELWLRVPSPALSLSDPTDLAGAALCIPAVVLLTGRAVPGSRLRLALDGGIVVGAVLLISWLTVLHSVYQAVNLSTLEGRVGVAYPLLDVASVAVAVGAVGNASRLSPALVCVAAAMVSFALADSVYGFLSSLGAYDNTTNLADTGYPAGFLVIAIASLLPGPDPAAPPRRLLRRWQVLLPYLPLVAAVPVMVLSAVAHQRLDGFTELILAAVGLLILVRQLMVVVESRALAGALASAVERWKQVSAERELLIQRAPVGICRIAADGRILEVNAAIRRMLGRSRGELVGHSFLRLVHPADRTQQRGLYSRLAADGTDHLETECRLMRGDGRPLWCSIVASPVSDPPETADDLIAIVEDISERKLQADQAAHIQRQLLPQSAPVVPGYELAAACIPASDVSGDLYDWVVLPDGRLDLVVADVMGHGVGAALVMAVLRTAFHSSPPSLGLAERVRLAAESIAVGITEEGLFVTLFYARLDAASGCLRYVDAGHGYCGIRRRSGEVTLLPVRSLPVGMFRDQPFREGEATLEPGDSLVVYSDGLVETEAGTRRLRDLAPELEGAEGAAEMVERLVGGIDRQLSDDVTVAVLRRRPEARRPEDDTAGAALEAAQVGG
jgi:PAS domain S-box-containing protein